MKPADGHPPVHALADLAEGVLDAGRADELERHVRTCPECADTVARLAEVTAILGAAPPTVPMPAHVSARIATALAAEHGAAQGAEPADAQLGSVSHLTPVGPNGGVAWFRRRLPQALAAAASVAVIGFAGYVVTTDPGNDAATTASGSGETSDQPEAAAGDDFSQAQEAPDVATDEGITTGRGGDATQPDALSEYSTETVSAAMTSVWRTHTTFADGCGQGLADAEGQALVGSSELGADVLVVLESTDHSELVGWLVPTCSSGTAEALAEAVTIPTPVD